MAMALVKHWLVITVLVAAVVGSVRATSNGAGGCLATADDIAFFKEHHGPAANPDVTGDYSIQTSATKFIPGCKYTISICGPSYKGFLLASRDMISNAPSGSFTDPSTKYPGVAKLQPCSGSANNAVTHLMPDVKTTSMHFEWTAPVSNVGDVHLYLTTVRTLSDWYQIETMFEYDTSGTTCPSTVPTANTCPAEGTSDGPSTSTHHMSMEMTMVTKFSTKWSGVNIVFPDWVIDSPTAYGFTLVAIFLFALLAEWATTMSGRMDRRFTAANVALAKQLLKQQAAQAAVPKNGKADVALNVAASAASPQPSPEQNNNAAIEAAVAAAAAQLTFTNGQHLLRTLVKVLLSFLSFFLMIVFMILEVGLCCALLAGTAVGYYLFGRERNAMSSDHCSS